MIEVTTDVTTLTTRNLTTHNLTTPMKIEVTRALARKEYHCTMAFCCCVHHKYIKIGDLSC
jgi:hypothetical protein